MQIFTFKHISRYIFYSAFFIQIQYLLYLFLLRSIPMDKFTDVASRVCSGFMLVFILMCLSWPSAFPAGLSLIK